MENKICNCPLCGGTIEVDENYELHTHGGFPKGNAAPSEKTKTENIAFASQSKIITEMEIPYGVTEISYEAFSDCTMLERVVIPDSVTKINAKAFYNCKSLSKIVIPESVKTLGEAAFRGC